MGLNPHLLTEGPGVGIGGEVIHKSHFNRQGLERKFLNMGSGIMGMDERTDQDGSDKHGGHGPYHGEVSELAFFYRKKKKQGILVEK